MKPVAIVTGGSKNIGHAIAVRLAAKYHVVVADICEPSAPLPDNHTFIQCDICDQEQVEHLIRRSLEIGQLKVLVLSAAITAPAKPVSAIPLAEWKRVLDVNLTGSFIVAQAAIEPLVAERGSIVFLASRAGKTGFAALNADHNGTKAHYCASKAGIISLMKSLAIELAPHVRVNAVAPGPIEGEMIPRDKWPEIASRVPLRKLGKPADVAEAVNFLIEPSASFISGHVLDVNGGTLMD